MSFAPISMYCMNAKGMAFCCKKCDKKITVEYEGGARLTLVRSEDAPLQLEYSERFDPSDHSTPDSEVYLYELGLCATCYESTVTAKEITNLKDADALYCAFRGT